MNHPSGNHPSGLFCGLLVLVAATLTLGACVPIRAPEFGPGPPPMLSPKSAKTLGPAPVTGATVKFAFAPLNGVPGDMRLQMERDLQRFAATRNLSIVPEGDPTATYHVTGYLSAVGDATGTLLVYVWDVTDLNGTPRYRVSGQEAGAGSQTDPWLGIKGEQVDDAARETIDKLADWVKS
jgi:hypothetical protein